MTSEQQFNWNELLLALKQAQKDDFRFNGGRWTSCCYGIYCRYILGKKSDLEIAVGGGTQAKKDILNWFGEKVSSSDRHYIFGDPAWDGPKTLTAAIARVEEFISKFESPKQENSMLTVKMIDSEHRLTFKELNSTDTFKYKDNDNKWYLCSRINGTASGVFCFNTQLMTYISGDTPVIRVNIEVKEMESVS